MTTVKDFQIISKLGEGAYSSVYKAKRLSDNQEYALKKVKLQNLSDKEKQNALNEVRILASIKHPNLIAYKEAFLEDNSNSLCIIMEYANNGDLFQKIVEHQKKGTFFSESEIWNYFIQMVKALKALHDLKIFHRDLKSANVFLNKDGSIKLGDLNVSKVAKKGLLYTQTGTPYYASPEVWRDMPYDNKADVWSLGCVLYEITTLKPPFRAEDMEGLYKKVLRGYYPKIQSNYSQDLSNVIRALLQVSPSLRPSCNKLLQLPAIIKRMDERHLVEFEDSPQNILLSTIRIPKNILFLAERLPKADYTLYRTRKIDKNKFMQTLAGPKDHGANTMMDEMVRGSESVDSFKKADGRIYLPTVNREAQNKNIMNIYGGREKKEQGKVNMSRVSGGGDDDGGYDYESEILSVRKNTDVKTKKRTVEVEKEKIDIDREKSLKTEQQQPKQSEGHQVRASYKVHNLDQDVIFEKHSHLKNVYGVKSSNRSIDEHSVLKGPKPLGIKLNKYSLQNRSPSDALVDYGIKKTDKLPPLNHDQSEKSLPPLVNAAKAYGHINSPKKVKSKELSKVYKVNIGEFDDIAEKYPSVLNKATSRARQINAKRYDNLEALENEIKGGKYKKVYENALF